MCRWVTDSKPLTGGPKDGEIQLIQSFVLRNQLSLRLENWSRLHLESHSTSSQVSADQRVSREVSQEVSRDRHHILNPLHTLRLVGLYLPQTYFISIMMFWSEKQTFLTSMIIYFKIGNQEHQGNFFKENQRGLNLGVMLRTFNLCLIDELLHFNRGNL